MAAPMEDHADAELPRKDITKSTPQNSKSGWNDRRRHRNCVDRVDFACKHNPYVKFMLAAMENIGCPVVPETHIICEPCAEDSPVNGGFDPVNGQIVLCENKSPSQRILSTLLTHELIHAYDHCRAKVDWTDLRHLACSEIRASSLSGDCSFLSDAIYSWKFRFRKQHQACVRSRALSSILSVRDVPCHEAEKAIDDVWDTCFRDHAPFNRIPRRPSDLKDAAPSPSQSTEGKPPS
ncbi:mitochondrial inner membrane protease ATP23 homolog [Diadema setosum]|uniref:mitochondrial inner membrane protease ATP23 homolog n=1 Tax=Diadema setosum TaxID=31175 RepID=UPI003B3AB31F